MSARKYIVTLLMLVVVTVFTTKESVALPVGWSVSSYNGLKALYDSADNLYWLSPTLTAGISYNEVASYLSDPNSQFYGLSYAGHNMSDLFIAYNMGYGDWSSGSAYAASQLMNDFGSTYDNGGSHLLLGVSGETNYYDPTLVAFHYIGLVETVGTPLLGKRTGAYIEKTASFIDAVEPEPVGHWLVYRAPVPEPSTWIMMLMGLAGLAWGIRRNKV